jgi:benzodiazapine receptor
VRIPIDSSPSYRGRNARPNWLALLAFVTLGFATGGLGAAFSPAFSARSALWYGSLAKPPWTPADALFGPVWTTLYLLMGIAVWLVWGERYHRARQAALFAFAVQLTLNALWAPLFFGTRNVALGLVLIIALWLSLAWTVREFATVRTLAACLMLPYFAWVSFAVALNASIWRHNI